MPLKRDLSPELISILDNVSFEGTKALGQDLSDENDFHFTFLQGYLKRSRNCMEKKMELFCCSVRNTMF